jgi:HEAT repeat protein
MADESISPSFRVMTAMSLGLLGDTQAVPALVDQIAEAASLSALASASDSLGLIGDRSAVPALLTLAEDEQARSSARAFACVALGLLGEHGRLPFNAPLRAHNNYLAQLPSIAELLAIL